MVKVSTQPPWAEPEVSYSPEPSALRAGEPADVLFRLDPFIKLRSLRMAGANRWLREDLYQEGAVAAFAAVPRFDSAIGTLDGFAASCALNRMRHVWRSHRYRYNRSDPLEGDPDGKTQDWELDAADTAAAVARRLDGRRARELLDFVLTPRERSVIKLLFLDGWSAVRTSKKLRISAPRVAQLKEAALAKLRVALRVPEPTYC